MANMEDAAAIVLESYKNGSEENHNTLTEFPVYTVVNISEDTNLGLGGDQDIFQKAVNSIYRPFHCPTCHMSFTRKGDMLRHHRKHSGEKPFSCPVCGDEFTRKDDMTRHFKTHQGVKPHTCPVCHKSFGRKADMVKHLLVHAEKLNNKRSTGCPTCGCPYSHDKSVLSNVAGKIMDNKHGCPECEGSFKRKMDLNTHIKSLHPEFFNIESHSKRLKHGLMGGTSSNTDMFSNSSECLNSSVTGRNESEINYLNVSETKRSVRGQKNMKSPKKEKAMKFKKGLEKYSATPKPFECPECKEGFGRKADMIRHYKIHTGIKPYSCPNCSKTFRRKEDMVRHSKTHLFTKKYSCKYCDAGFAKRTEYALHLLDHDD